MLTTVGLITLGMIVGILIAKVANDADRITYLENNNVRKLEYQDRNQIYGQEFMAIGTRLRALENQLEVKVKEEKKLRKTRPKKARNRLDNIDEL